MAVLATVGAIVVATAGVLLSPGVASATPGHGYNNPGGGSGTGSGNYPPTPPSLTVSSGTVKAGKSVRVSGRDFGRREPVVVRVRYRPSTRFWFPRRGIVTQQTTVWTNNQGRFSTYAHTFLAGTLSITATGLRSRKSASVSVRVLPRGGSHGWGTWWGAGAPGSSSDSSSGSGPDVTPVSVNITPNRHDDGSGQLFLTLFALSALVGSAALTRQVVRRRRVTA
jgi:hypothetical protein